MGLNDVMMHRRMNDGCTGDRMIQQQQKNDRTVWVTKRSYDGYRDEWQAAGQPRSARMVRGNTRRSG